MSEPRPKCSVVKPDGTQCQAYALPGQQSCVFHDPNRQEAGREARRRGARTRNTPPAVVPADAEDLPLETPKEIQRLLADSINRLRKGNLDPRIANAIGYLATGLLKTLEWCGVAEQLEELKREVDRMKGKDQPDYSSMSEAELDAEIVRLESERDALEAAGYDPAPPPPA
jgi:hypothetical protein